MENNEVMVQCYNRGCGQKFAPSKNSDDSCRHHPGVPFFHDAYKGWTCCNKKCTDFTEFLNIKGCIVSYHSNVKPIEPEKPVIRDELEKEVIEVKPMIQPIIERPPIDTPLVTMKPQVMVSLKQHCEQVKAESNQEFTDGSGDIPIGTSCKNKGCMVTYEGSQSNETPCIYHSGSPIFHEGMKYWSCCQKKTTDFNVFLNQIGCQNGTHLWKEECSNSKVVDCRWDWHQTGSHVVLSIYAKQYCPETSIVQLSPIRLFANLVFPQQDDATFTLDIELEKVINVKASEVSMYNTKVEIKLKKAEPGSWTKINIPRPINVAKSHSADKVNDLTPQIESVDLSDL